MNTVQYFGQSPMIITRLMRQSWSCMSLAVRMLTLVAFTAHAVLGCCLSHGSCMREQVVALSGQCCDHEDHSEADHVGDDDDEHSHQVEKLDAALEFAVIGVASPFEGHGHPKHCNDGPCVFGLSGNSSGPTGLQILIVSSWISTSANFWRWPCSHGVFLGAWLDGPPSIHVERSVLQVWLI